jgi:hypothetical protein
MAEEQYMGWRGNKVLFEQKQKAIRRKWRVGLAELIHVISPHENFVLEQMYCKH